MNHHLLILDPIIDILFTHRISPVAPHLNYITDIILELKVELTKINTELKKLKNQLSIINLSLVNEVRHSEKSACSVSIPFQQ